MKVNALPAFFLILFPAAFGQEYFPSRKHFHPPASPRSVSTVPRLLGGATGGHPVAADDHGELGDIIRRLLGKNPIQCAVLLIPGDSSQVPSQPLHSLDPAIRPRAGRRNRLSRLGAVPRRFQVNLQTNTERWMLLVVLANFILKPLIALYLVRRRTGP